MSKESFDAYTKALQANNSALLENDKLAKKAATDNINFSVAIDDLNKILKDQEEALKDVGSPAYYEAISSMSDAVNQMLGVDVDTNFIAANLEKIK